MGPVDINLTEGHISQRQAIYFVASPPSCSFQGYSHESGTNIFIHLSTKAQFEVYCKRLSCSFNPPFFNMNTNLSSPYFPSCLASCVFSILPHVFPLMSCRLCVKSVNAAVALWQRSELQCRSSGSRTLCFVSSSVTLWPN